MKRVNMSEREEEAGGAAYACLGAAAFYSNPPCLVPRWRFDGSLRSRGAEFRSDSSIVTCAVTEATLLDAKRDLVQNV